MNKTLIAILLLVVSMVGIPTQIHAESEVQYLVRLATQAQDHIRFELSNMENVPDELVELYEHGSNEVDALVSATEEDDVPAAREHFLSAMKSFKEIGELINQQRSVAEIALAQSTDTSFGIKPVIDRMERYVDRLKGIAERNQVDIDFKALDELITTAKNNYNKGDLEAAEKTIDIMESLTLDVYNTLKDDADQKKTVRAKDFAEKQIQRIDVLIVQAKDLGLSENITKSLEQSKLKLTEASNADQIATQTRIIISIKNQVDKSKENRIDAVIDQLEAKIKRLSTQENIDTSTINRTKSMLDELKLLVVNNKLDDAFRLFQLLNNLLNDIENSTKPLDRESENIQRKPVSESKPKEPNSDNERESLSDSKTERIKMKIRHLEDELQKLEQKAADNPAAKRWIKNSLELLEEAKNQVDDSPEESLEKISEVEKILARLYRMLQ